MSGPGAWNGLRLLRAALSSLRVNSAFFRVNRFRASPALVVVGLSESDHFRPR